MSFSLHNRDHEGLGLWYETADDHPQVRQDETAHEGVDIDQDFGERSLHLHHDVQVKLFPREDLEQRGLCNRKPREVTEEGLEQGFHLQGAGERRRELHGETAKAQRMESFVPRRSGHFKPRDRGHLSGKSWCLSGCV